MKRWALCAVGGLAAGYLAVALFGNPFAAVGPAPSEADAAQAGPTTQPSQQAANAPSRSGGTAAMAGASTAQVGANAPAGNHPPRPQQRQHVWVPARAQPAPRAAAEYPSAELVAACRKRAAEIRKTYGKKLTIVVHPPFVIAGDMDKRRLELHANGSVVRPAKAMWASYFDKKPDKVITTYLFAGEASYKQYAKQDYPSGGWPYYGYYTPSRRTMAMNINTGGGTLVHELTHALIVYDFPNVPTWFNEGLASLHEQCSVGTDKVTGLTNWRLGGLQKAVAAGTLRPLKDLITKRDFYGAKQGINYAQARYFVMYMQHKGLLRKFYLYFREHAEGEGADLAAVEHVFGQSLDKIEPAYIAWVKTLKFGR